MLTCYKETRNTEIVKVY